MNSNHLKFEVDHSIRIMKPAQKIFEAIVSPKHLNRYFTYRAEGQIEVGQSARWNWTDHQEYSPIEVVESSPPKKLIIRWDSHKLGYKTTVQFDLEDQNEKGTIVRVREGTWKNDEDGLKNSYDNSGGWMHMLCCLKAYLDFGIDLRSKPVPEAWEN